MGNIGVFDSGVGGLSVLQEIRKILPNENLTYLADAGHLPYGNKSDEYIRERGLKAVSFLVEAGAKAIVVACNTATALSVAQLRTQFHTPIIAMEPAVKPALKQTENGKVGVLATEGTLQSQRYATLVSRFAKNNHVFAQACPGLVEQIEKGELTGTATESLVQRYTEALIHKDVDVIVLGCTHYPFLKPLIESIAGESVAVIDSGAPVAQQLAHQLNIRKLSDSNATPGNEQFWTTGTTEQMLPLLKLLWEKTAKVSQTPVQYL